MRIATWNVNSIKQRLDHLATFVKSADPDIVCLQELKCVDEAFPRSEVEALGYNVATHGQKAYNGVAILSRLPMTKVVRNLPDDEPEAPRRLIAATIDKVRIVNVYVPNGQSPESEKFVYKMDWLARLRAFLGETAKPGGSLVLLGDFNIAPEERDVRYPDLWRGNIHFHPREHEALARITSWGLYDLLRKHHEEGGLYSWWDYRQLAFQKNNGLRIDLILVHQELASRLVSCRIDVEPRRVERASDHTPVIAEFGPPAAALQ